MTLTIIFLIGFCLTFVLTLYDLTFEYGIIEVEDTFLALVIALFWWLLLPLFILSWIFAFIMKLYDIESGTWVFAPYWRKLMKKEIFRWRD